MKKFFLLSLLGLVLWVLYGIGVYSYEYLYSRYGVLPMKRNEDYEKTKERRQESEKRRVSDS